MTKSRVTFLDGALLVAGVFVILLIASSALGWTWMVRLGPLIIVWPNWPRHGLFLALGVVVAARVLLWRDRGIASETPAARVISARSLTGNGWLVGALAGLLTVGISHRAFGVPYLPNIPYHRWARWALEHPLERLPLISMPGRPEISDVISPIWYPGYYRPLPEVTYLVDLIWGAAPAGVLLFNIVIYSVLAAQVGRLAQRLTQDSRVVWASALIFALFPLHAEVVLSAEFRNETLYSLFYLSALIWFMDFERTQERAKFACSLAAFLLAILSKELGFSFPLLLGFYLAVSSVGGWWSRLKRIFAIIMPYVTVAILVILYRVATLGMMGSGPHGVLWLNRRLVALGSLVFSGLVYPLPFSVMPASTLRLLAVALLSVPLFFLLRTRSFDWRPGFLLGALPISASLSSDIIELYETGWTVWYFTLPSAFFSIAVALSVFLLPGGKIKRFLSFPVLVLYVAVYAIILYLSNGMILTTPRH